jgi:hypothetical protein
LTEAQKKYHILGVSLSASQNEIRQAYLDLVRVWHPDRFIADARLRAVAEEKLKEITQAYRALSESGPVPEPPLPDPAIRPIRSFFWERFRFESKLWLRTAAFSGLFAGFLLVAKTAIESRRQPPVFVSQPRDNAVQAAAPEPFHRAHVPPAVRNIDPKDSTGAGEFVIRNETGAECSLRMVRANALDTTLRRIEMRVGEEASIDGVPTGIYKLRVSLRGGSPDEFSVGPFQFVQTESSTERRGDKYTLILKRP